MIVVSFHPIYPVMNLILSHGQTFGSVDLNFDQIIQGDVNSVIRRNGWTMILNGIPDTFWYRIDDLINIWHLSNHPCISYGIVNRTFCLNRTTSFIKWTQ